MALSSRGLRGLVDRVDGTVERAAVAFEGVCHEREGGRRHEGVGEFVEDVVGRHSRQMHEVVSIEAIVAQVVIEDFIGREIETLRQLRKLLAEEQKPGF